MGLQGVYRDAGISTAPHLVVLEGAEGVFSHQSLGILR